MNSFAGAPAEARSARRLVTQGVLRVGPLMALPDVLREFRLDPAEVLAELELEPSRFADPEHTIPFTTMGQLLGRCVERTGCAHFGLLVGQRAGASCLGLVGFLMQQAPDVGAALRELVQHLHLHDRGGVPTTSASSTVATLGYAIYHKGAASTDQIYDAAVAIGCNIMRGLCGPDWHPREVLFSHSKPRDVGPFRRFFQAPLRFDAEQTTLVFPARWLDHPVSGADPLLHRLLAERVRELEEQEVRDEAGELRRALRSMLPAHQCSLEEVVRVIGIHRRTLNRRLRAQGTTFQKLVDEVRYEIARQLLQDTRTPLAQIAATLDYADASVFTRAFERWSGVSPSYWRREHRVK